MRRGRILLSQMLRRCGPLLRAILMARDHLVDWQSAESGPRRHERHGNTVDLLIIKMRRMDRVVLAARSVAEIGCRS